MAWTGVMCLVLFINSIVWNGNAINWAPIWCDISKLPCFSLSASLIVLQGARMYVGIGVAVPATSLCIARRLYKIAAVRNVIITKAEVCLTDP
jgi:pheromone a factor receptor